MALQRDFSENDTPWGFAVTGGYARVVRVSGDKNEVQYDVEVHMNKQARDDNKAPLMAMGFHFTTPTDTAILPAAYADLKSREGWTSSVDV